MSDQTTDDPNLSAAALWLDRGDFAQAESFLQKAVEAARPEGGLSLARALGRLGELHQGLGRVDDALKHLGEAVSIGGAELGSDDPELLGWRFDHAAVLGAQDAGAAMVKLDELGGEIEATLPAASGMARWQAARAAIAAGRPANEGLSRLELAVELLGRDENAAKECAACYADYCDLSYEAAGPRAAETIAYKALAFAEEALSDRLDVISDRQVALGDMKLELGQFDEAGRLFALAAQAPEDQIDATTLASARVGLGRLKRLAGEHGEARQHFEKVVEVFGDEPEAIAISGQAHGELATLCLEIGDAESAVRHARVCLRMLESMAEPEAEVLGAPLIALAQALMAQDTPAHEEAEPLLERAMGIYTVAGGNEHPGIADTLLPLATLYSSTERQSDAMRLFERAAEIYRKRASEVGPLALAMALNGLGVLHMENGEVEEARSHLQEALDAFTEGLGANHPQTQSIRQTLDRVDSKGG